jgi:hypothetical protein
MLAPGSDVMTVGGSDPMYAETKTNAVITKAVAATVLRLQFIARQVPR